ncbi:dehydrogenase [Streptomyces bambusae]|uniref:Dehydrogenase n=1 Tax=Streptomyces bambusae TaxID=1550616 RepID=A0ABS6YYY7_9ACTN|nr:dehydrogenase [Streptomyces bambusae]MBW5480687.1 dehydrogenase [Streptomyces bambusae]
MTNSIPNCSECSQAIQFGGFVLSRRAEDDQRVCRSLGKRAGRHVWWHWADRPDEALEVCPTPQLFR